MANASDKFESHPPAVTEKAREQLLGKWYGDQVLKDGTRQRWLITRSSEGAYISEFETTDVTGKSDRQTEIGYWGIRYPIYFTTVQYFKEGDRSYPADTRDPSLYDAYRVMNLDDSGFRYRSYTSGTVFEVKRVDYDFTLDSQAPAVEIKP
jgi:hypothetical protein